MRTTCRTTVPARRYRAFEKPGLTGVDKQRRSTRRGILERLGRSEAGITELANAFGITLTGIKKHVGVLEAAGLVTTEKIGRVRFCRLGPHRLDDETAWIAAYRRMLKGRLNRLGDFLERTREKQ